MSTPNVRRRAIVAAGISTALVILIFLFVPPIKQDESYHSFSDSRAILGIPNFWNVVSNLPFAFVGILGLRRLRGPTARILFAGVLLTSMGSGYYHLAPSDARLVWDRLPMTMVFMAFLSWVFTEEFGRRWEMHRLGLLVCCGVASIVWWQMTGDLRPYVVVQFGPIVVLLAVLSKSKSRKYLCSVLSFYVLAKCVEYFDRPTFSVLPISGHTFKHFLAALACYFIYRWRLDVMADPAKHTRSAAIRTGAFANAASTGL